MNFEGLAHSPHAQNEKYEEDAAASGNSHPGNLDIIISVRIKWKLKN